MLTPWKYISAHATSSARSLRWYRANMLGWYGPAAQPRTCGTDKVSSPTRVESARGRLTWLTAEAGAEDRVHDRRGARERVGGERLGRRTRQALEVRARIAAQLARRSEQQHAHIPSQLAQ